MKSVNFYELGRSVGFEECEDYLSYCRNDRQEAAGQARMAFGSTTGHPYGVGIVDPSLEDEELEAALEAAQKEIDEFKSGYFDATREWASRD